jgi:hypothetical protein
MAGSRSPRAAATVPRSVPTGRPRSRFAPWTPERSAALSTTPFAFVQDQRRAVAGVCKRVLPFVTPGLDVSLARAKDDGDGSFSYETTSDKRLTISGRIRPAPAHGRILLRREVGAPAPHTVPIAADGRFVFANLHLRKLADNSFTLSIQAAPNAPRNVHVSAICLDCLAGNTPPSE